MNLYAYFERHTPADRNALAIQLADGTGLTWYEMDAGVARIAHLLRGLGLPSGARVAAQVEKSPEALLLYLATLRAGLVYLPLNPAYQQAEMAYFLADAEPGVLVCDPAREAELRPLAQESGVRWIFTLDARGRGSLADAANPMPDSFKTTACTNDELAAILYTSGTTGRSKGAMLSHGNLISNALVLKTAWQWRPGDVLLHALPIFHVHGLFVACHGALLNGSKMIWLPRFDAEEVLRQLPRATVFMGVPTMYVRMLAELELSRSLCADVRVFICGSAPLAADTFRRFAERTGHAILERYGMSETLMLTSNPYTGERVAGTVGTALPGVSVRVVNETGQPCAVGEIGQIEVKGPNVFQGYWRMPEKTHEEFTADRYFKTGDVGYFGGAGVPDAYLSIVGRSKDLIISGGFNVYPKEVESYLDEIEGVVESAVIGVPHPDFGEAVNAVVVLRKGTRHTEEGLIALLKSRIAGFKVPKRIHVADELPRNAMGKVQKNLLRERFGGA
jgi:malonyl-CoA/methylmalonyl-CoA synthetase